MAKKQQSAVQKQTGNHDKDSWADQPISFAADDKLNRTYLADKIADRLWDYSLDDPFVISITGGWGTGKTSFLNLMKEHLKNKQDEFIANSQKKGFGKGKVDGHYLIKAIDFSPWNALSQDSINDQFFDCISSSFRDEKFIKSIEKLPIKELADLGLVVAAAISPPAGVLLHSAFEATKKLFDIYKKAVCVSGQSSLIDKKRKLESRISETRIHYVVFIDDLDRLNKDEIKLVIQLVKSVLSLKNFIYVLAFDEAIVSSALNGEQKCGGEEYLEKIVQFRYELPEIDRNEIIIKQIKDEFNKVIGDFYKKEPSNASAEKIRIEMAISQGLFKNVKTLRETNRFVNSSKFSISEYLGKLYVADFLSMEYLAMFHPGIMEFLDESEDDLFGISEKAEAEPVSSMKPEDQPQNKFLKEVKDKYGEDASSLIGLLFPYAFSSGFIQDESNGKMMICQKALYDSYRRQSL